MNWMVIVSSVVILLALGLLFGWMLGIFSKVFYVKENPLIEKIKEALPQANCGACGFSGCGAFAEAVANGNAPIHGCVAGGQETIDALAQILGISQSTPQTKYVAVVLCKGDKDAALINADAKGASTCLMAHYLRLDDKVCRFGCLGFGDCVNACPFGALSMTEKGLPFVNTELCTGCGLCVEKCPREIIKLFPDTKRVLCLCSNHDTGSYVRKACKVGCISCGLCVKKCPEKAIAFKNNLPVIDIEKCNLCGKCVTICPMHSLTLRQALTEKDE
ncbi:MAG: RnfABCDGE type electron transport complex subunit B [Caldisericia bacterium]|nr:RnfABCDGE type electron transport complex subunit B [Caldisericia bacterium]MDD4615389.1 RnfABCDGE type electron transport complex subunit B [Caldisericia bacterium]